MRRYQIAYRPLVFTGEWSLRGHGAKHSEAEANKAKIHLEANGYEVVLLPLPEGR